VQQIAEGSYAKKNGGFLEVSTEKSYISCSVGQHFHLKPCAQREKYTVPVL